MSDLQNDLTADENTKNRASLNPDAAGYGADHITVLEGIEAVRTLVNEGF